MKKTATFYRPKGGRIMNVFETRLRGNGTILTGHFVYQSGKHGSMYVAKDMIFRIPETLFYFCDEMAKLVMETSIPNEKGSLVFIGPATAGVALAPIIAYKLKNRKHGLVLSGWADKKDDKFVIGRSFADVVRDRRVVITEDILTTGDSVNKVEDGVITTGGTPVLITCMWNRGETTRTAHGTPIVALVDTLIPSFDEADCPLCKKHVPLRVDFGHGAEWLTTHPDYPRTPSA